MDQNYIYYQKGNINPNQKREMNPTTYIDKKARPGTTKPGTKNYNIDNQVDQVDDNIKALQKLVDSCDCIRHLRLLGGLDNIGNTNQSLLGTWRRNNQPKLLDLYLMDYDVVKLNKD